MVLVKEGSAGVRESGYIDPQMPLGDVAVAEERWITSEPSTARYGMYSNEFCELVDAQRAVERAESELTYQLDYPKRVAQYREDKERLNTMASEKGLKGALGSLKSKWYQKSKKPFTRWDPDPLVMQVAQQRGILSYEGLMGQEGQPPIAAPVRLFDSRAFGLSPAEFVNTFGAAFDGLPFDTQDVRANVIRALQKHMLPGENWTPLFKQYYYDHSAISKLGELIQRMDESKWEALQKLHPWRQRAVGSAEVTFNHDGGIFIKRLPKMFFSQGESDDIRSWLRDFPEMSDNLFSSRAMRSMLANLLLLTASVKPGVQGIKVTSHLMGVVARKDQPGDNAPEGPHKDGCFAIISAGVIRRHNIVGGESVVYRAPEGATAKDLREEHVICRTGIEPAQFLFQADESATEVYGENLWHDVTPIKVANSAHGDGIRQIIGFDVELL